MKKTLLATAALALTAIAPFPLSARDYEPPKVQVTEPNLATDGSGDGIYYVYHVATQMFLTAGNNYGTQLSIGETGQKITLAYGEERPPLMGQEPEVSGEGWTFNMKEATSNSGFHEVYFADANSAYVDCDEQGHTLFQILLQDNGCYMIKAVDQDELYGAASGSSQGLNGAWGVVGSSTIVYPAVDPDEAGYEEAERDWQFVTIDDYNTYIAKQELYEQLIYASDNGYEDVETYESIYSSANVTCEEVEDAARDLHQIVIDNLSAGATTENPIDFTSMITNPTFDSDNTGWTDTQTSVSLGHQSGASYQDPDDSDLLMEYFMEKWRASSNGGTPAYIYQELEGMPSGRYQLKAKTIGYYQGDYTGTHYGYYLFAKASTYDQTFRTEAHTLKFNALMSGTQTTDAPCPRQTVLEFYSRGGNLTIGVLTDNTNCNWIAVDDFELYYLGLDTGLSGELLNTATQLEEFLNQYEQENVAYSLYGEERAKSLIETARATAEADVDDDSISVVINAIQTELENLAADASAYEELYDFLSTEADNYWASPYEELTMAALDQYLTGLQTAYDERTFDPDEIDNVQATADQLFIQEVFSAIISGETSEATGLLVNPSFTGSNDGWTHDGDGNFKNESTNISEIWNGTEWEMYQKVSDLPTGFYKITAQAFYSPKSPSSDVWHATWGVSGDTFNNVLAYLYANDASAQIHHVADYPQEENMGGSCELISGTADSNLNGMYLPVDKTSAEAIFTDDEENYLNTVYTYVDDGQLILGIRLSDVTWSEVWVCFDNFQLQYMGEVYTEGAAAAIESKIAEAEAVYASDGQTTIEALERLLSAINNAYAVLKDEITVAIFQSTVSALDSAISQAKAALELVSELDELVSDYDEDYMDGAFEEYDESLVDELLDLVYEAMDCIEADALETSQQVQQFIDDMNLAYGEMVLSSIDYSYASIDSPVDITDVLLAPSFSETNEDGDEEVSMRGWTSTGSSSATSAMNYEFYNLQDVDIHQSVYGMPKGYYRLSYNGFYRAGGYIAAAIARRDSTDAINASAYVETSDNTWSKPLLSIFDGISEYKFTTNDVVLPDSLYLDESKLYNCIVDDVTGTEAAFQYGEYQDDFSFYVAQDASTVTIGISKGTLISTDWTIFDNFRLYYYGDGDNNRPSDYETNVDEVISVAQTTITSSKWFTINGLQVTEPLARGIYIRVDALSDGSKQATKILIP